MSLTQFVQVVFPIPLDKTFTYVVPPSLAGRVGVGARVSAPFGSRVLRGVVTELLNEAPPEAPETPKPLEACLDEEPLVGPELMELARWVAGYYCSSLGEALKAATPRERSPGGARRRSLKVARLVSGLDVAVAAEELRRRAPVQARILEALAGKDEVPLDEVRRLSPGAEGALRALVRKGLAEELEREEEAQEGPKEERPTETPTLTEPQKRALAPISQSIAEGVFRAFLLHGVTGSGKTEVYLRAIAEALDAGRSACVLVPEIALTTQLLQRFRSRFPSKVAVLHSGLSASERSEQWMSLAQGRASICVGARSAVFAPLKDLGVVVVDEEHDGSYKQEESPRYHAREVALVRARNAGAVAILGSATPSLESRHNVERGKLVLLELPERVEERRLPRVEVVDLRGRSGEGRGPAVFSPPLEEALKETASRGEQALLLLNRRGFANIIQCKDCGHVFECANCSVSLTYHAAQKAARCHWCGESVTTIRDCPGCGGALFHYGGLGTQRVEEEVRRLLPGASVARMDRDTTSRRGAYQELLQALGAGEIDVLVGTQMIAKGHDYPNITLVGVVSADTSLHVPDFRAAERTFQLLTQVAGRTGRGEKGGQVVVQTYMPDHYAVAYATRHDYAGFYAEELRCREAVGWPPFRRLAIVRLEGARQEAVEAASRALAASCRKAAGEIGGGELLGPAWAAVARVRNRFRRQVLLKHPSARTLNEWVRSSLSAYRKASGPGLSQVLLRVDVDPVSAV